MDPVIEYYNDYNEEKRFNKKANNVEFITTTSVLDEIIEPDSKILDVAAGTGAYTFYYAEKGHQLVATDIVPKHIKIINNKIDCKKNYRGFLH